MSNANRKVRYPLLPVGLGAGVAIGVAIGVALGVVFAMRGRVVENGRSDDTEAGH